MSDRTGGTPIDQANAVGMVPGDGIVVHRKPLTVVVAAADESAIVAPQVGALVDELVETGAVDFGPVAERLQDFVVTHQPVGVAAVLDIDPEPIAFLFDQATAVDGEDIHRGAGRSGWTTVFVNAEAIVLSVGSSGESAKAVPWTRLWAGIMPGRGARVPLNRATDPAALMALPQAQPSPTPGPVDALPPTGAPPVGPAGDPEPWGQPGPHPTPVPESEPWDLPPPMAEPGSQVAAGAFEPPAGAGVEEAIGGRAEVEAWQQDDRIEPGSEGGYQAGPGERANAPVDWSQPPPPLVDEPPVAGQPPPPGPGASPVPFGEPIPRSEPSPGASFGHAPISDAARDHFGAAPGAAIDGPSAQPIAGTPPMPGGQPAPGPQPGPEPIAGTPPMPGSQPAPDPQPIAGTPPLPGGPPMPNAEPIAGTPPLPGGPPMPNAEPIAGTPPLPGGPPMPNAEPIAGTPPMPNAQPIAGTPPMPDQPPLPGNALGREVDPGAARPSDAAGSADDQFDAAEPSERS